MRLIRNISIVFGDYVSGAEHRRRVSELLGANNRRLEEKRSAEEEVSELISAKIHLVGMLRAERKSTAKLLQQAHALEEAVEKLLEENANLRNKLVMGDR